MNPDQLQKCTGCSPHAEVMWLPYIEAAMSKFSIISPTRQAMFLAQAGHESGGLVALSENLNYSAAALNALFSKHFAPDEAQSFEREPERIANRIYAGRMGNGDEASGDGWRFRGRGPIQITGRDNYHSCGLGIGFDLLSNPDQLSLPGSASAFSAAWFWWSHNLNMVADKGDILQCTRIINGGEVGLDDRTKRWEAAKAALNVQP